MMILDEIGKLFNEHASAAVMKERLNWQKTTTRNWNESLPGGRLKIEAFRMKASVWLRKSSG